MSRLHLLDVPLMALLWSGCQSEAAALEAFCALPERCSACATASPAEKQAALEAYINKEVRNRAARALIDSVRRPDAGMSSDAVSRRARALGLSSCPMSDPVESTLPAPLQLPEAPSSP